MLLVFHELYWKLFVYLSLSLQMYINCGYFCLIVIISCIYSKKTSQRTTTYQQNCINSLGSLFFLIHFLLSIYLLSLPECKFECTGNWVLFESYVALFFDIRLKCIQLKSFTSFVNCPWKELKDVMMLLEFLFFNCWVPFWCHSSLSAFHFISFILIKIY